MLQERARSELDILKEERAQMAKELRALQASLSLPSSLGWCRWNSPPVSARLAAECNVANDGIGRHSMG